MSAAQSSDEWCPNCGEPTSKLNHFTGWCIKCSNTDPYMQLEMYLSDNADHIEHYIARGNNLLQSIERIRNDTRPTCLCCGVLIKRGPRSSQICTGTPKCRKTRDRYHYLHKRKNMSKAQALAQIMRELNS